LAVIDGAALPELTDDSTDHERVEYAMSLLGGDEDDDVGGAGDGDTSGNAALSEIPDGQAAGGDDTSSTGDGELEETTQDDDAGNVGQAAKPATELPNSVPAELKSALATLDPESQRAFAQWQAERDRGVSTKLQESAEKVRTLEAQVGQVQPERQRLAQQLELATTLLRNFDPVLTRCAQMTPADWSKLANEDAAGFVQLRAEYEQRSANLNSAMQQRQELDQRNAAEAVQRERPLLLAKMPELADPVAFKAYGEKMNQHAATYGFKPEEVAKIIDHRMVLVLGDAMKWREQESKRQSAAGKLARPVPAVVRPGKGGGDSRGSQHAALLKRAAASSSNSEIADLLAAAI
jgi:hypothetical protein